MSPEQTAAGVAPDVRVRLIASEQLRADHTTLAAIEIDMPASTKTYWRVPGETGIPTELEPYLDGQVSIPRRARLGVLRQDHFRYEETPILQVKEKYVGSCTLSKGKHTLRFELVGRQEIPIGHRAAQLFKLWEQLGVVLAAVEERDRVAATQSRFDQVPSEEDGAAEDEQIHRVSLWRGIQVVGSCANLTRGYVK